MSLTLQQAKDVLRLDNDYNDAIINDLVSALPRYIESSTGLTPEQQDKEPLCITVSGFLIQLWYNAEGTNAYRLTQVIESLLKTISIGKKDVEI